MIVPELPSYLDAMGGGEYKGLIIALFTVTAGLSRPFSGKLADKVGRVPVMVVGALVSGVAALLYPLISGVIGFFLLRFFHGFSTGFKPTGTSAYVADIVPVEKRGEAMGVVGFFSSLGMAAGPALGAYLASEYSLNVMFYSSSASAILSVLILIGMKETLKNREKLSKQHFIIRSNEIYEPNVLFPSLMMMAFVFPFGAVLTVIPDLSDALSFSNRGVFFTCFTFTSLLVRIFAGKASDKYGRIPVLKIGAVLLFIAMISLAMVESQMWFIVSGGLFGIAVGICSPTIFAWTIDRSHEEHRGRGIATMYIALEIGIGLGAFLAGLIYNNDLSRIPIVFYGASLVVLFGLIYLYFAANAEGKKIKS